MPIVPAAIPWKELIRALPILVSTADKLWKLASRPKEPPINPRADLNIQVASIGERLVATENTQIEQAEVLRSVAAQLQTVARRTAIAYWLGVAGLALACLSLAISLFRL